MRIVAQIEQAPYGVFSHAGVYCAPKVRHSN
jgi:hypothetical protein